jgi:hypothetical protein
MTAAEKRERLDLYEQQELRLTQAMMQKVLAVMRMLKGLADDDEERANLIASAGGD